jgi:uncharacterized protein (DUF1697 family)
MMSIVLLRGINVGGNRKIPMANLRTWLSGVGFQNAQTYIQSGNVVIEHAKRVDVVARVHNAIEQNSGFDVPVIVRSAEEMSGVVASNPYPGVEPTRLLVSFLHTAPDDATLQAAAIGDWQPEEFTVVGRDVYLHLPSGVGQSLMVPKLTLIKSATTRNWNTVLALVDLATRGAQSSNSLRRDSDHRSR